jgi:hypothetical protein
MYKIDRDLTNGTVVNIFALLLYLIWIGDGYDIGTASPIHLVAIMSK